MEFLIPLVLAILAVLGKSLLSRRAPRGQRQVVTSADSLPYIANGVLLSAAERSFFGVLQRALPNGASAFPKVRAADVLSVRKPLSNTEWRSAFNRISSKHFDFIVCRKADLHIYEHDDDRGRFLGILGEAMERWRWLCHAYFYFVTLPTGATHHSSCCFP